VFGSKTVDVNLKKEDKPKGFLFDNLRKLVKPRLPSEGGLPTSPDQDNGQGSECPPSPDDQEKCSVATSGSTRDSSPDYRLEIQSASTSASVSPMTLASSPPMSPPPLSPVPMERRNTGEGFENGEGMRNLDLAAVRRIASDADFRSKTPVPADSPLLQKAVVNPSIKRIKSFNKSLRRARSFRMSREKSCDPEKASTTNPDLGTEVTFLIRKSMSGRIGWKIMPEDENLNLRLNKNILEEVMSRVRDMQLSGQTVPEKISIKIH